MRIESINSKLLTTPQSFISGLRQSFRVGLSLLVSVSLTFPTQAFGQSLAVGNAKYLRGDFKGAETSLIQALSTKPPAGESAKIFKLLGIAQYMQGNQAAASHSFSRALSLSPGLRIDPGEVLDESVIGFFDKKRTASAPSGKNQTNTASANQKRIPRSASPATAPTKTAAAPGPKAAARDGSSSSRPAKQTILKIQTNVVHAQISIDGILAGRSGELINTDPGVVPVEITAPGYVLKKLNVTITKDRENALNVTLEKIAPPPPPKPKALPSAALAAKAAGRPPQGSIATPHPRSGTPRAPAKTSLATTSGQGGEDLFAPSPKDQTFYDTKAPVAATPPGVGGGKDLAAEFEADTAAAAAPPPMPVYPGVYPPGAREAAPPGAGQPVAGPAYGGVYVPPPASYPYAPPGGYYGGYSPAPIYTAPLYTPPPTGPGPDMGAPGPQSPGYNDPAPLPDPAYSDSENAFSIGPANRKSSKKFIYILPFGIGQFVQKRYLMGTLFFGGEVGLLGLAYTNYTTGQENAIAAEKYKKETCQGDLNQCDQDPLKEYNQNIRAANKFMLLYSVGAAGLAFAGAIEALIKARDPDLFKPTKKKGKGQRQKGRKYKGFSQLSPQNEMQEYRLWDGDREPYRTSFTWDLGINARPILVTRMAELQTQPPVGLRQPDSLAPFVTLDLSWAF